MRTYIAGPIAGRDRDDYERHFAAAEDHLRHVLRLAPVNPLHVPVDDHEGGCPPGYPSGEGTPHTSACHLRADIKALLTCNAIYLLAGWERSRGATVEKTVAEACGMQVLYEATT